MNNNDFYLRKFISKLKKARIPEKELAIPKDTIMENFDRCSQVNSNDESMESFYEDMNLVQQNIQDVLKEIKKMQILEISDKEEANDETDEKKEIENKIVDAEVEMENIEDELESLEKEIHELDNTMKDLNENKFKMERSMEDTLTKLQYCEQESKQSLSDIKRMNQEIMKLDESVTSLEQQNAELEVQKQLLEAELYERQINFEDLQERFSVIENESKNKTEPACDYSLDDINSAIVSSKLKRSATCKQSTTTNKRSFSFKHKSYARSHPFTLKENLAMEHSVVVYQKPKDELKEAIEMNARKLALEKEAKHLAIETSEKNSKFVRIQNAQKIIEKEIKSQRNNLSTRKSDLQNLMSFIDPKIDSLRSEIAEIKRTIENIRADARILENKKQEKEFDKRRLERNRLKKSKEIQKLEIRLNVTKNEFKQKNVQSTDYRDLESKLKMIDIEIKKSMLEDD